MKIIPVGKYQVMVDDWNYDRLKGLKLNARDKGVCVYYKDQVTGKRKSIQMAYVIIQTDAPVVDHKDRNPHNMQVHNLRPCTRRLNQANRDKPETWAGIKTSSRYKGVSWSKQHKKWRAYGGTRGTGYRAGGRELGHFSSEIEAAQAHDRRVTECYGEFAVLNFPTLKEADLPLQ